MEDSSVKSKSEKRFQVLIYVVLGIAALCAILPFILLLSASITDNQTLLREGYSFIPKNVTLFAYEYLFKTNGSNVLRSYGVTLFVTVCGTVISLLIAPLLAWPLSRKDFKGAKFWTFYVFFTMLFNGGLVPQYIMWTQFFEIKNTIWALILPNLVFNGFYVILFKSNFSSNIHPALVEAAKIDGAGEWYIYFKVVLPLSLPIMATIGLLVALGYWNDWTNGIYYITDSRLFSLQQYLKSIIDNISALAQYSSTAGGMSAVDMPGVSIRMAVAVIGVIPIMVLYPFFQKAFVAGIALGGVKE